MTENREFKKLIIESEGENMKRFSLDEQWKLIATHVPIRIRNLDEKTTCWLGIGETDETLNLKTFASYQTPPNWPDIPIYAKSAAGRCEIGVTHELERENGK